MQLHRTTGEPDWASVPKTDWNTWQRLGAHTNSIVTPGNIITIGGVLLALLGLWLIQLHHYWVGLSLLAVGRFFDILDGWAANATGTKTPLGETLDAGFDKIISLVAFIMFLVAHVISLEVAALLFIPNFLSSLATFWATFTRVRLHPALVGKWSMAANWFGLGCFIIAKAAHLPHYSWLDIIGLTLTVASFVLGMYAASKYYLVLGGKLKSADL